ncbi:hypothetical protein Cgig2_009466 [Carnegiea gigantea]|uniref:EF-hand domain-containing protein n=1 Tax=Carnegiea gigantea TaxID=171969 RepID=A0A9Q1K7G2_9CARY|nr:hypothetical protein Cgig2_009466 [Carnegiea gigantea]
MKVAQAWFTGTEESSQKPSTSLLADWNSYASSRDEGGSGDFSSALGFDIEAAVRSGKDTVSGTFNVFKLHHLDVLRESDFLRSSQRAIILWQVVRLVHFIDVFDENGEGEISVFELSRALACQPRSCAHEFAFKFELSFRFGELGNIKLELRSPKACAEPRLT